MADRLPDPDVSYVSPSPGSGVFRVVAATDGDGAALTDGTPTLLTFDLPDDGQVHVVRSTGNLKVTSDQTGGGVTLTWTLPDGTPTSRSLNDTDHTAGQYASGPSDYSYTIIAKGGTTVAIVQTEALTVGDGTFWGLLQAS